MVKAGGGFAAIRYSLRKASESGGLFEFYRRMRSKNTCKSCSLGMGGQAGGMVDEGGHYPEVCKKSVQVQAADMQRAITESFFEGYSLAELERWSSMQFEEVGRLAFPVMAAENETHFRRVSWAEALDRLSADLGNASPEASFFYASGRSSNEAAFLLQVLARAYGTRNIHNASSYCHQASSIALTEMLGSGTATVQHEDLDLADLAIVLGANPASSNPRLIAKLIDLRRRGGKVIVINPLKEIGLVRFRVPSRLRSLLFGSDVSDIYLQPNIGSDIALLKALLKGVIERGAADRVFLSNHVEGWEGIESDLDGADWGDLIKICGVGRAEIERAADAIAGAKRGIALWAVGLTQHQHGCDNVAALVNLTAARGWVGKPGCGLMPIRGHCNIQGVGSVGFTPGLTQAFSDRLEQSYGISSGPGLDTFGSTEAAHAGRIRAAVMLGGNLWGSSPDLVWATEAMRRIGTTAYIATKLNAGHVHGRGQCTLLLPVLARDEEVQSTTQESMFNYVRLSDGGHPGPEGEAKSEVELVCALAARLLPEGRFPFEKMTSHKAVREVIARIVPGYAAIGQIDEEGGEFHVAGRTFHDPRFNTPSGKLRLRIPPTAEFKVPGGEFRLMTVRSEGQVDTVVYEEEDLYRGNRTRDVVMMNRWDCDRLGLGEFDPVAVESATGRMTVVVAFADLPPGNVAMYYPEANVLVPRRIDPASGTPAFKSVAVRIVK
jgi:molybdopterin-dependent oxidoreductase alpha subunit